MLAKVKSSHCRGWVDHPEHNDSEVKEMIIGVGKGKFT